MPGWIAIVLAATKRWSTKAAGIQDFGPAANLKIEDVEKSVAEPGEVLVRVAATNVDRVDWKARSGASKNDIPIDLPLRSW